MAEIMMMICGVVLLVVGIIGYRLDKKGREASRSLNRWKKRRKIQKLSL